MENKSNGRYICMIFLRITFIFVSIQSKNHAVAICGFDFDGDGVPELVTGT